MKWKLRTGILAVLGIMLIFSIPLMANTEEEPVKFANRDLEFTIRERIGKAVGDIYPSDLEGLTTLRVDSKSISNLAEIGKCKDLKELDLSHTNISDLSLLSELTNLRELRLSFNNISDLSPLSGLTNLETLTLYHNNISNLSPSSELFKLQFLDLRKNNITDIQPLIDNFKVKEDGTKIGLGEGDIVKLQNNSLDLSEGSEDLQDIQTLMDRGVKFRYYPQKEGESS